MSTNIVKLEAETIGAASQLRHLADYYPDARVGIEATARRCNATLAAVCRALLKPEIERSFSFDLDQKVELLGAQFSAMTFQIDVTRKGEYGGYDIQLHKEKVAKKPDQNQSSVGVQFRLVPNNTGSLYMWREEGGNPLSKERKPVGYIESTILISIYPMLIKSILKEIQRRSSLVISESESGRQLLEQLHISSGT